MKKLLLISLAALGLTLCSCEKDEPLLPEDRFDKNQPIPPNNGNVTQKSVITELYQIKMRRELFIPFSAYVIQINNRDYYYMIRLRFNADLKVGDEIDFSVFTSCPNEISQINGYELGDGTDAEQNDNSGGLGYLFATDPIEASIEKIFSMKIRYSISFLPTDTWFIKTTDGNLVFVKKSKVNISLSPGDRIVYSKYTLYDEIVAIKKL